jgi:hypothetical protein
MRTLRSFIAAVVLVTTLTLPTFAGDITTMGAPPPTNTDGDIHTGVNGVISTTNAEAATAGDSVTVAALSLLQSVLSLF